MPHAIDPPDAATVDVSATTGEGMGMIRVTSTISFESTIDSGSDSQASIAPEQGTSLRSLNDDSLTEMLSRADLTTADRERYNRALANVDILEGFGSSGGVYERGHLVLALLALMRYVESCEGRGLRLRHRPVSLAFRAKRSTLSTMRTRRTARQSSSTSRSRVFNNWRTVRGYPSTRSASISRVYLGRWWTLTRCLPTHP